MKLLYLLLAIFLAMEPVMSECWMNGRCRLVCKNDEDSISRCQNRKRCCVPSRYLTIQPVTIDGILDWTTPQMPTTVRKKKKKNRYRG
ncbi:beta-defensin 121-like [Carlito syrichta]|uniref:Beta-defensin n=1 Tax=Carlito syrichta TaxID=1868482 RepID=A0A1U7T884_CARSF|nr:beta-defensin 121-like [Carlito syrichta]